ncbi:Exocyst complex component 1 [Verticillium dahliae VDG2]|nr:Exocyst complex component 1 [Verticillium dahliae VDG2]
MRIITLILYSITLLACNGEAKAVFAHFMVGNTASYNQALWETEMELAKASRIDAFALNIARGEKMNADQIKNAFAAARVKSFKLLFSFDYAGRGPWPAGEVLDLLRQYAGDSAHFMHNGLPLVSTFEGPDQANDWISIKAQVPCFFVPDWSSKGAEPASKLANGVADGLFNWAAWPNHPNWSKDTYIDASYRRALGNKPYMMPVSPWFYTNLPKYDKNWLWRGETLWFDRWAQALHVQPEWIQIISWNDYGESHYIGPIRGDASLVALDDGKAPFNYVKGIEHGAWRAFLPYAISLYKTGTGTITQEGVMMWYRQQSVASGCNDGGTTAYTATHMQPEGKWTEGLKDGVFFAAQLGSNATAEVTIGGQTFKPSWRFEPHSGVGIYTGFVHTSALGAVRVDIRRNGGLVASAIGAKPIGECQQGYYNFNPVIYLGWGASIAARSPPINIKDAACIEGTGIGEFEDLCKYTCKYNYCPVEACMCLKYGPLQGGNIVRGPPGYPAANRDTNYDGLCAVACSYEYCPLKYCGKVKLDPIVSSVSPFTPKSCTSGRANPAAVSSKHALRALEQICSFGCKHGYCPIDACVCDKTGALVLPKPDTFTGDKPDFGWEVIGIRLLCRYTCGWGVCPQLLCRSEDSFCAGGCAMSYRPCYYQTEYASLEALAGQASNMEPDCASYHGLNVLANMLEGWETEYEGVKSGYDDAWPTYEQYIRDAVEPAISKIMTEKDGVATKFFKCWRFDDGVNENQKHRAREISCTGDDRFWGPQLFRSFWFDLIDVAGFNATLEEAGVDPEWVTFDTVSTPPPCLSPGDQFCNRGFRAEYGYPVPRENLVVPNPKDLVGKAFEGVNSLHEALSSSSLDVGADIWHGSPTELFDVLAVPVLMVGDAIESMKEIKDIAKKVNDAKKKDLIMLIIESILMVLPLVGVIVGQVGRAGLMAARLVHAIEAGGSTALTLKDVIENPDSAPVAIAMMVLDVAGAGRSPDNVNQMSQMKSLMDAPTVNNMGKQFKLYNPHVNNIVSGACKKS